MDFFTFYFGVGLFTAGIFASMARTDPVIVYVFWTFGFLFFWPLVSVIFIMLFFRDAYLDYRDDYVERRAVGLGDDEDQREID